MSADNLVRITKKKNGLYQVRHESASSLIHALQNIEPTEEELLIEVIADDIDKREDAIKKAQEFIEEYEQDGGIVEYGIVGENWNK